MEKFKIVIKGKSYIDNGENLVDFGVAKKGDVNAMLNALLTVVCDMCIENDVPVNSIAKSLKAMYSDMLKEREEDKDED